MLLLTGSFANCFTGSLYATSSRYDQVTWLTTHNAMNAKESGWLVPNQTHSIAKQLDHGVRALMLDVWKQDGKVVLRHGPNVARLLGSCPLSTELATIHTFLIKHPDAILTLIFESYVPAIEVAQALTQAKLDTFCHTQDPTKPWPSLKSMRSSGKRLVVFSDKVENKPAVPDWYMNVWKHCWETNWEAKNPRDLLNANPRRGKQSNQLLILNHFLTDGVPSKKSARIVNEKQFLTQRIQKVRKNYNTHPSFLVLDFYEIGDASDVIKTLKP